MNKITTLVLSLTFLCIGLKLNAQKTVYTSPEVNKILREMQGQCHY